MKKCKQCIGEVPLRAKKCQHCGSKMRLTWNEMNLFEKASGIFVMAVIAIIAIAVFTDSAVPVKLATKEESVASLKDFYPQIINSTTEADKSYEGSAQFLEKGDLLAAYSGFKNNTLPAVKNAQSQLYKLKTNIPPLTSTEEVDKIRAGLGDLSTGYYMKQKGIESLLEAIDGNKVSQISEAKDNFSRSQSFLISGLAKIWGVYVANGIDTTQLLPAENASR